MVIPASRSELLKRLRASLRYKGHEQAPQMQGSTETKKKPLFA